MHSSCFMEATVAFSSGEAEYYAQLSAATRGLQLKAIISEAGVDLQLCVYSDSSAGRAMAKRLGGGRIRHIEIKYFSLQQFVKQGA